MRAALLFLVLTVAGAASAGPAPDDEFVRAEEAWRAQRLARLTSESGWLSLVGLHWLKDGENRFGADPGNDIVLPKAPAHAGSLFLEGGSVRIRASEGVTLGDAPVGERTLRSDADGEPDTLHLGRLVFFVIKRNDRFALRVKDPESPARKAFHGLEYFPADPRWRVVATFTPFVPPKEVAVPTILGTVDRMTSPGRVTFTIDGKPVSLEPVLETPDAKELFFIFKDRTSGKETYPAARYLYTDLPADGKVTLDFNRAYNPPCAFTSYATCPFPTKENVLPVRVVAGEKEYAHH